MPGLTLLVVGGGRQGQRHVRAALASRSVSEVITADPFVPGLEGIRHVGSIEEATRLARVDAVIVAAPTKLHASIAKDAIQRRLPVLVEKPLAATSTEGEELVNAAVTADTGLFVGHVERFNPVVMLLRDMLMHGRIGKPLAFTFRRVGLPPVGQSDVDVIHDLAVHDIDVFSLLAGSKPSVEGAVGWPRNGLVESAHILLRAGDLTGSLQCNWRTPVRLRDFTITTDTCYIEANYTTQGVEVIQPPEPTDFVEFAQFQSHYGSSKRIAIETRKAEPLVEQLESFLAAIRGESSPLLATGKDGLWALVVADEATALLDGL